MPSRKRGCKGESAEKFHFMMMIYDFYDKPHKSKGMNGHDLLLVIKKGFVWNVSMELQWDQEVCNGQLKILIAKLDFHLFEKKILNTSL